MVRILLVDDLELVRAGIKHIIGKQTDFEIIGLADSGETAIRLARELKPDVIVMDVDMPGMGGIEATKRIHHALPETNILILTIRTQIPFPARMLKAGAKGFISKNSGEQELIKAISAVSRGERYISHEIAKSIAFMAVDKERDNPFDALSHRELQVMLMLTRGEKVQTISESLHLSSKTVCGYRYRIFAKLGVESDVELTHLALKYGMIELLSA